MRLVKLSFSIIILLLSWPLAAQDENEIIIYRDEDSLTIFVAGSPTATLAEMNLSYANSTGDRIEYRLDQYQAFWGLFDNPQSPICLRLERANSANPVPIKCQRDLLLATQQLFTGDAFWYDPGTNLERSVFINTTTSDQWVCPAGENTCTFITLASIPDDIVPAAEGEILVVVAEFAQTSGSEFEPHIDMLEVMNIAAEEVPGVRVVALNRTIQDEEEAQQISDLYNATMVVYGRSAPGGVTARYEITSRFSEVRYQVEGDFRVSSAQIENFEAFIYDGMDSRYILGLSIGQLHYFNEEYTAAITAFDLAENSLNAGRLQAVEANILYSYRGNAYDYLEKFAEAIADYDRAIAIEPQAIYYYNRGNAYQDLDQYETAIADYDRALQLDPQFASVYNNRGFAYYDLGQYETAIADYDRALQLDPDEVFAYNNRGNAYANLGQYERAIGDYDRAIELDPEYVHAYNGRGSAYDDLGQYERAIGDYDRANELDPEFTFAYNNRGVAYIKLGQNEMAISNYDQALALDPEYADAYHNRGNAYANLGHYEKAIGDYDRAIELNPEYTSAYDNRGNAYANLGQYETAIADYDRALQLDPEYVFAYNNRGNIYANLGKYETAIADYDRALQLDPEYANAYRNRSLAYRNLGEYEQAVVDTQEAIRLNPQFTSAYWTLGSAFYEQENYAEALESYRQYLELAGDNASSFVVNRVAELEAQLTPTPEN